MTPAAPNRAWALAEARKDLERLDEDGTIARYGWRIDKTRLEQDMVVYVAMCASTRDGTALPDGDFELRLDLTYFPTDPPIIHYVNPKTRTFDRSTDARWLPKIAQNPPGIQVGLHLDHDNKGQLVCHSYSFEYYYRAPHSPTPAERWTPGLNTIGSVLFLHHQIHQQPYYGGRHG